MDSISLNLGSFFEWLLKTTIEGSILICLILLVKTVLRDKLPIRWHYYLWLLLLIRLVTPWAPQSRLSIFNLVPPILQAERILPFAKRAAFFGFASFLSYIWLIGAMILGGFILLRSFTLWRVVKRERPVTKQKILDLLEDCKMEMGIQTILGLVVSDRVKNTALFGFIRPRLLLPKGMIETHKLQELRHIFIHELAHLKQRDIYLSWAMTLLQVVYWFNPLMWFALRRIRVEREFACDELALSTLSTDESPRYGHTIVNLLEKFSHVNYVPSIAGIIEDTSQIERRIKTIAGFKATSRAASASAVLVFVLLASVALTDPYPYPKDFQYSFINVAAGEPITYTDVTTPYLTEGWWTTKGWGRTWEIVASGGPDGSAYASITGDTQYARALCYVVKDEKATRGMQTVKFDLLFNNPEGNNPNFTVRVIGIRDDATEAWNGAIQGTSGDIDLGSEQAAQYVKPPYESHSAMPDDGTNLLFKKSRTGDFFTSPNWQHLSYDVDFGTGYEWVLFSFAIARGFQGGDPHLDIGIDNVVLPKTASVQLVQAARIIIVDADSAGTNDGSSWADAYNYLQDALAAARQGDQIRVAQGIYKPDQGGTTTPGDREATFQLKNRVTIHGGYAGFGEPDPDARDVTVYETILNGDLNGDDVTVVDPCEPTRADNSYHVVTGSRTNATVLDGFVITAGNANGWSSAHDGGGGMYNVDSSPTVTNCTFSGNSAAQWGGGMFNFEGNPIVTNCTFSGNSTGSGGGMRNADSNPRITNCTFSENSAAQGGGISNGESNPSVTNCTFSGNSAEKGGGGMVNDHSSPTVTSCTFSSNSAEGGGGMRNGRNSNPTVTNCTFSENSAEWGAGMENDESYPSVTDCTFSGNSAKEGGGMRNVKSHPIVTNCIFSGNLAAQWGGGMFNIEGNPIVTNCTFSGNSTDSGGGGMRNADSNPRITNCIFSGNRAHGGGGMSNGKSDPSVSNCTFSGNSAEWGGGMINDNSRPTVTNCSFSDNSARGGGGGMYNQPNSKPTVTNCTFTGNSAHCGGGMGNYESSTTLTNCTFTGNEAAEYGGGMNNYESRPSVTHCTFSGNSASWGGGMGNYESSTTVTNCILWGDSPTEIDESGSATEVNYSNVKGGWFLGTGNINRDPLFISGPLGDYYLSQTAAGQMTDSPCVDAGCDGASNLGLDQLTTRTDGVGDEGIVDMGYHYPKAMPMSEELIFSTPINVGSNVNSSAFSISERPVWDIDANMTEESIKR